MNQLKIVDGKATIKADPQKSYALRIFDGKTQVDYRSTRLGTLEVETDGVSFDCPDEIIGLDYELKVPTGKVEVAEKGTLEKKSVEETVKIEKPVKKGKEDGS